MSPQRISGDLVREAPFLREHDTVEDAVRTLRASSFPALPVVDSKSMLRGLFGEREFMAALFPGYVGQLGYAGFVGRGLDEAIERRVACRAEPVGEHMNTDHVEVGLDFSDIEIVETFLHHRVLVIPVVDGGRVDGVITRADFFARLADRFLDANG
jgi:CBS domain-containing protein